MSDNSAGRYYGFGFSFDAISFRSIIEHKQYAIKCSMQGLIDRRWSIRQRVVYKEITSIRRPISSCWYGSYLGRWGNAVSLSPPPRVSAPVRTLRHIKRISHLPIAVHCRSLEMRIRYVLRTIALHSCGYTHIK
jgi:hypothetical protein